MLLIRLLSRIALDLPLRQGAELRMAKTMHNNFRGLLSISRLNHATGQRDNVFAIYGVLKALGIPLPRPEYEKSQAEIFFEFTRAIFDWHESLQVLIEAFIP